MRVLRNIIIGFLLVLLVLFTAVNVFVFMNRAEIKAKLLENVNKQLNTQIKTGTSMSISPFQNFPYISIQLPSVTVKSAFPKQNKNFIVAEDITFLLSYWSLLQRKYQVKKVIVNNGVIDLIVNEQGEQNFNVIKQKNRTQRDTAFMLVLDKVEVKNSLITYKDYRHTYQDTLPGQDYLFNVEVLNISGTFQAGAYTLDAYGEFETKQLFINGINYIKNTPTELNTNFNVTNDSIYNFKKTTVKLDNIALQFKGKIRNERKQTFIDLVIDGKKLSLHHSLPLVPDTFRSPIRKYDGRGKLTMSTQINGYISETQNPLIDIDFKLKGDKIDYEKESLFTRLNVAGHFTNGKEHNYSTSKLTLPSFKFRHHRNDITIKNFELLNFNEPLLKGELQGTWEVKPIDSNYLSKSLTPKQGKFDFENIRVLAGFKKTDDTVWMLKNLRLQGHLSYKNISFIYEDSLAFKDLFGNIAIQNDQIHLSKMEGNVNGNDFLIEGRAKEYIPLLKRFMNNKNAPVQTYVSAEYTAQKLNLNQFFFQTSSSSNTKNSSASSLWSVLSDIHFTAKYDIAEFQYGRFQAQKFRGNLNFNKSIWRFKNVTFQAMDGKMEAKGLINLRYPNDRFLGGNLKLTDINIKKLFYQLDNFGQRTLTDHHLEGELTTDIYATLPMRKNYSLVYDSIYANADVTIVNGELIDFEPTQSLSSYVNVDALKHIKFYELKNQVRIKDQVIYIPTMDIYSNAMNLTLAGTHNFDNHIDYKIKVKLSQLLSKKVNQPPGEMEKNKKGGLNLYLTMKGPATNPAIKYDRTNVKEKLNQDLKAEKESLKKALKKEFSDSAEQDTIKEWEDSGSMQFIEWGDSTKQQ